MDFIELLTKVWMESEKREWAKEEWERKRQAYMGLWQETETDRLEQPRRPCPPPKPKKRPENEAGARSGPALPSRPENETDGQEQPWRPCPPPKPKKRPENEAGARNGPALQSRPELQNVLNQPSESFGSLSRPEQGHDRPSMTTTTNQSLPPKYADFDMFQRAPSSQTEVKQPMETTDTLEKVGFTEAWADHSGKDRDSSTPPKARLVFDDPPSHPQEVDTLTPDEKSELMDTIKKLAQEQEVLKTKIKEHDEGLMTLLARKNGIVDEDMIIDAQIEKLYANLCRIHLPVRQKSLTQCLAKTDTQTPAANNAICSTEHALHQENKDLKEQIRMMEHQLKQSKAANKDTEQEGPGEDNNIESLKYLRDQELSASRYVNCSSGIYSTIDNNLIPCPYDVLKKDVHQVSAIFEWNIPNYCEKLEMEKRGKIPYTVSEPFHIGQCGHLARLEVYLNGSGRAKNIFMSVYLRIIQGAYDDFLQWPAVFSLTFILINQEDNMHGSLLFRNDRTVFTYNKPSSDSSKDNSENVWGLVQFVSHSAIQDNNYIKDDMIKLRIDVEKRS